MRGDTVKLQEGLDQRFGVRSEARDVPEALGAPIRIVWRGVEWVSVFIAVYLYWLVTFCVQALVRGLLL